jgi:hypothetical protein
MPNPVQRFVMYIYLHMLELAFLLTVKQKSRGKRNIRPDIHPATPDIQLPPNQSPFTISYFDCRLNALSKDQYAPLLNGTASINHRPKTLLALRTFGKPHTADFLFHIANKWIANYGHVACLMDATLARYEFGMLKYTSVVGEGFYQERLRSNHSIKLALMMILCGILYVIGPVVGLGITVNMADITSVVYNHELLFYLVIGFVIPWLFSFLLMLCVAQSLYVKNEQSVLKVTQSPEFMNKRCPSQKKPFRLYTFYCQAESWHFCLEMVLAQVDAIVMDIRGIAEENMGCRHEISLLSDRGLLRKTTFIIDGESDRQILLSTLSESITKELPTVANLPKLKTDWSEYRGCPKSLLNDVKRVLKYEPGEIFALLKTMYDGNCFPSRDSLIAR